MILLDLLRDIERINIRNYIDPSNHSIRFNLIINSKNTEHRASIIRPHTLVKNDTRRRLPDNFSDYFLCIYLINGEIICFNKDWKEGIYCYSRVAGDYVIFNLEEIKNQDDSYLVLEYGKILQKQIVIF